MMSPTPCFSSITRTISRRPCGEQGSDFNRFGMEIGMLLNVFLER